MLKKDKELLKQLIEQIVQQEAPPDAPYGQYLFADPIRKYRKDNVAEPDTEEEKEFFNALITHIDDNKSYDLEEIIDAPGGLRQMKQSGYYLKYISPPNVPVYRTISVDIKTAAKILELDEREVYENPERTKLVAKSGILHPFGREVQSWTVDLRNLTHFFRPIDTKEIIIVFAANPTKDNNDFYLNPYNIVKNFDTDLITQIIKEEYEVISYGPVHFDKAIIYSTATGEKDMPKEKLDIVKSYISGYAKEFLALSKRYKQKMMNYIEFYEQHKNLVSLFSSKTKDVVYRDTAELILEDFTDLEKQEFDAPGAIKETIRKYFEQERSKNSGLLKRISDALNVEIK